MRRRREGKGREKRREEKRREGKGREGKNMAIVLLRFKNVFIIG